MDQLSHVNHVGLFDAKLSYGTFTSVPWTVQSIVILGTLWISEQRSIPKVLVCNDDRADNIGNGVSDRARLKPTKMQTSL